MKKSILLLTLATGLILTGCNTINGSSSSASSEASSVSSVSSSSALSSEQSAAASSNDVSANASSDVSSSESVVSSSASEASSSEVVSFSDAQKAEINDIISAISGEFGIKGTCVITAEDGVFHHVITGFFKNNEYFNKDVSEDSMNYDYYVEREDGIYYGQLLSNNTFKYIKVTQATSFDMFKNPFINLSIDDFKLEDGKYVLDGSALELSLLTGWNYKSAKAYVSIDANKKVSVVIKAVEVDGENTYNFEIVDKDAISPNYKSNVDVTNLGNAIKSLEGGNFTVTEVNHEDGTDDITSTIYVTPSVVYNSYGTTPYGYAKDASGKTYEFTVTNGVVTSSEFKYDMENYAYQGNLISPDFFIYDEAKDVYKFADASLCENMASAFGFYVDATAIIYNYVTDFEIKLKEDGTLDYFMFYASIYGSEMTFKYTFSNIGTTVAPYSVTDIVGSVPVEETSIPESLYGTYVGDVEVDKNSSFGEKVTIEISKAKVMINGVDYSFVEKDGACYVVSNETDTFYIGKLLDGSLVIWNENETVKSGALSKPTVSDVDLTDYVGTFSGDVIRNTIGYSFNTVELEISATGVKLNGTDCEVVGFTKDGDLEFVYGEDTLYAYFTNNNGTVELYNDGFSFTTDKLKKASSGDDTLDLSSLYGTYSGDLYVDNEKQGTVTVVISEDGVSLDGYNCEIVSFDDGELEFSNGYDTYYFSEYYGDLYYMGNSDYSIYAVLEQGAAEEETEFSLSSIYGTWTGKAYSTNEDVTLVISEDSITVNGVAYEYVTIDDGEIEISNGETSLFICEDEYYSGIDLYNSDYSFLVYGMSKAE